MLKRINQEEAYNKVYDMYHDEDIILDSNGCEDTKYYALDDHLNGICKF